MCDFSPLAESTVAVSGVELLSRVFGFRPASTMKPDRIRIYVAGPLSSGDREENVRKAVKAGVKLIKLGFAPLIPHLTHYVDPDDALTHKVWLEVDLPWVNVADAVLRLSGKSKGADMETQRAGERGIPVFVRIKDLCAWYEGDQRLCRKD